MESSDIDYDHARNLHTLDGATAAFADIFGALSTPKSLLDVGCGIGTWMRAAMNSGVADVRGIDGIIGAEQNLHVSLQNVERHDLSKPFSLGRHFEVALCLEVAEHLPETSAAGLISSIAEHTDTVLFSAACPGQPGQNHVNCQWPSYWQGHFNKLGFRCEDAVRWQIWDDVRIEPWYRQNMFWSRRDPAVAGSEARIKSVLHPELLPLMNEPAIAEHMGRVEHGSKSMRWYVKVLSKAFVSKVARHMIPG